MKYKNQRRVIYFLSASHDQSKIWITKKTSNEQQRRRRIPHSFVEFCNFRLEVGALVSQKSELADVAWLVAVRIVVTQFGCVCVSVCIVEQEKAESRSRKTT